MDARLNRCPPTLILLHRSDVRHAAPAAPPLPGVALMPLRFPDQFPSFREVDGLSDTAFRLYVTAFFWCSVNQTDGLITREDLDLVSARVRASERFAAECERRGAWHDARHDCGSEFCTGPFDADGWVVHDYLRYAPSKAEAAAEGSAKSKGGRRGNHKKWHEDRGVRSPGCEFCQAPARAAPPVPKRTSHKRSHTDRISDSHATPISRSDFDSNPDRPPPAKPSRSSSARNARAIPDDDDRVISAVIAKVHEEAGVTITSEMALTAIREVRKRADRAGTVIQDPVRYFPASVVNERDVYALALGEPPPLADILAEFRETSAPGGWHEFAFSAETGACAHCRQPEVDKVHRRQKAAS